MNDKQVKGSFGNVEYRDNNVIAVPLQFDEPVLITSKTVFGFSEFTGDNILAAGLNFEYSVFGRERNYEVQMVVPAGKQGSFKLELKYNVMDPKTAEPDICGIVDPIVIEFDTPSLEQRIEKLEKVVLFLMQNPPASNYNQSGEEMMKAALPAQDKVKWVSKLLHQFESSEKAIEQYHDLFEERLGHIDK